MMNLKFGSVSIEELHERFDKTDPNIELHYSKDELAKMSEYEKLRLRNIKRNYLAMNAVGIAFSKPDFMQRKVKAPADHMWSSTDSDSDKEWTPCAPRKKRIKLAQVDKVLAKTATPVKKSRKVASAKKQKESATKSNRVIKENPDPPIKPPHAENNPEERGNFRGFTDRFIDKRLKALERTIRHRQRMVDLLDADKLPVKYLDILDPIVWSDDEDDFERDKYGRLIKKKKETPVTNRYPRRNIKRHNYAALEVPSDDEFLYCEDCQREFQGACPEHGPLNFIPEKKEINFSLIGTDKYAKDTLLAGLVVKQSLIKGAGQGVFTEVKLTKNSVYGPYDGRLTKNAMKAQDTGYAWLIFRGTKGHHYVDGQHKGHSNWMRYVNCACNEQQQNLQAFQYQGGIYYKVLQNIAPGSELLVWYGNEYAKELGLEIEETFIQKKPQIQPKVQPIVNQGEAGGKRIKCKKCKIFYVEGKIHLHTCREVNQVAPSSGNRIQCEQCNFYFLEDKIHLHTCGQVKNGEGAFQCSDCLRMYVSEEFLVKHRHKQHGAVLPLQYIMNRNKFIQLNRNGSKTMNSVSYEKTILHATLGFNPSAKEGQSKHSLHTNYQDLVLAENAEAAICAKGAINSWNTEGMATNLNKESIHGDYGCQSSCTSVERTHTGVKPCKCQYYDKMFSHLNACKDHERTHKGEKPYKCQYCDIMFSQLPYCKNHERTHTGEKPYKCQYCDKMFSQLPNCKTHERTHTGEKSHKCQYCDKMFSHLNACKYHERTHTGEKPYKCQYCDKMFSRANTCKYHERTHTGEKTHKCQYCDKMFSQLGSCKDHERTHTGEKPYKCQYCDKMFSRANTCKNHERTHTGEKPYNCQYCDKMFSRANTCKNHERAHTGEKPFKCQYCDKIFSQLPNCKTHERTHTGEKPYKCQDYDKNV